MVAAAKAGNDRRIASEAAGEPGTLSEVAYQRLRTDIVSGALDAGKPLRLEALKQRYGLSFSPLREALMRLQSERLVLSTALRGFSVAPLSREEMKDATETRILIESDALRRSMQGGDDDWEAGIVAAFHALSLQAERQSRLSGEVGAVDMHAMDERHYQFHRALIAHCGSPRLLDLADQLYVETQRYRLPCLVGRVAGTPARDVAAEHQQIMDATLRRSEDAVGYLAEHYRRTAEIIEASTVWPSPK
ncbi:FCD domain-containing protein [Bradyrhizobium sp. JYMT SZCCT0180]|uniref:GntR family transcriptional regulator n=1 Tax=Bradyrhizobium sp. JYMT SZCCT0180 TaxID=2807666 RepID=UPI001BAB5771|nr:FCD domain-containing protein [Bradyrhizobium sp. JYMT SZCCT0180]MBR1213230.1 FCD domain-containing protein [Bradyrhizobium sp. JYMT SZCCT0180]